MEDTYTPYIAYFTDVTNSKYAKHNYENVLAVSDSLEELNYYLKKIRGLKKNQYVIRKGFINKETAIDFYYDYFLSEFMGKWEYLTNKDIRILLKEINDSILYYSSIPDKIKELEDLFNNLEEGSKIVNLLRVVRRFIDEYFSSTKMIKKISNIIIKKSDVLSKNIYVYFDRIGCERYDKEILDMFQYKLYND